MAASQVNAQKEWSNWYYNGNNLVTFKNGNPEIVQNFINPVPDWQTNLFHFYFWGQGGISYSDPVTGEMKFIISNRLGFDRNYKDFPNENFLRSCPDRFSYHIIPFTSNKDKFYVVQFQSAAADLLAQESGLQVRCPNAIGLAYAIVDLTANNGLGDFTSINQPITGGLTEHITLVRHANKQDVWVIVHGLGNSFYAYLFTDNGIQPPVTSTTGPSIPAKFSSVHGGLTATHAGNMIAGTSAVVDGIMLFDFDNATGRLSNYRTLKANEHVGRLQFSPDDSKLYYSSGNGIYQFDFNQVNVESTLTKVHQDEISDLIYDMQLAPNGKIYFTKTYVYENGQYNEYTGSIECPNLPQYACNVNKKALNTVAVSFPDLVNDFIKDPKAPPIIKFDLGNDTAICFGSYKIKAPDGWESYKWNTGETAKEITVTKAGTYYVLTGNTGFSCPSGYGYINVGDKAIKLNLGKDSILCPNLTYQLHISDDYTNILWANGSNTKDTLATEHLYGVVSANDKNGCFTKDTIQISYQYYPRAIFGPDTTLCNQQTLTLMLEPQSNPFYSGVYSWQDGSTLDSFKVTTAGTYWGKVSYQGCTVSDTIRVGYINLTNISLGNDTLLCEGDSIRLRSNIGNASYVWNTGETTESITVKQSGQYIIRATSNNCTLSDTINVTFNPPPAFSLGKDTTICPGMSLTLDPAIMADTYLWQNGSANKSISATQAGWYWLRLSENGCTSSDSVHIDHFAVPKINLGNDASFCAGDSLVVNAGVGFYTYHWNTGAATQTLVTRNAGQYIVDAKTADGCIAKDTLNVTNVFDNPVVLLDSDSTLCTDATRYLDAGDFSSYHWNTGHTGRSIAVTDIGVYTVNVTDQNGCAGSGSARITRLLPLPENFLPADTVICQYGTLNINPSGQYSSYWWSTNAITSSVQINSPGIYWLRAKDGKNCEGTDSIIVSLKDCMEGLYVPTAFSPNNDGLNDLFRPLLFGNIKQFRFTIYNRWGQPVFHTTRVGEGWDGTNKGTPLETTVFVWSCTYQPEGQEVQSRKGSFTLVR